MSDTDNWEVVLLQHPITRVVHVAKKAPPFAGIIWITSCGQRIYESKISLAWLADRFGTFRWMEVKDKTITCLRCRRNGKQVRKQNDK